MGSTQAERIAKAKSLETVFVVPEEVRRKEEKTNGERDRTYHLRLVLATGRKDFTFCFEMRSYGKALMRIVT